MLQSLIENQIFPSPLILEGPGSEAWIQKIALHALCETSSACGHCRSCKQVAAGFHPDWLKLKDAVKIDELRAGLNSLRRRPYESSRRVLSFENLQEANAHVQNALLKTFEEPLEYWVILASVNSRFGLLPTIRSRCLLFRVAQASSNEDESLSDAENRLFSFITEVNELGIHKEIETFLKDRQKAKATFHHLLEKASQKKYPGHWQNFAPVLEECLWGLRRNLNPKILWDAAWAKSFVAEL